MLVCAACSIEIRSPLKKYCTLQCYWKDKKGKSHSHGWKTSMAMKGVKKSPEHVKKVAEALRGKKRPNLQGEKHFAWKGEQAHYDSLHDWVARYRGREKKCSACGLDDPKRTYHWANLSGEYKRDLDDWARLCIPCHSALDAGRNSMAKIWIRKGNQYLRR